MNRLFLLADIPKITLTYTNIRISFMQYYDRIESINLVVWAPSILIRMVHEEKPDGIRGLRRYLGKKIRE